MSNSVSPQGSLFPYPSAGNNTHSTAVTSQREAPENAADRFLTSDDIKASVKASRAENRGASGVDTALGLCVIGGLGIAAGVCIDTVRRWLTGKAPVSSEKDQCPHHGKSPVSGAHVHA